MASISFLFTFFILATTALAAPFEPATWNTTAPALSSNATTSTLPPTTTSLPAFPALVNSFLLQPLIDFNNRVSQAANSMPDQFSDSGKSLGSALVVPIQFGTNVSNNLLTSFNSTVLSVSSAVHPIIISPLSWMVNTTMGNITLNAFNYSVTQLGNGITGLGGSVTSAGDRLQNKGHTIIDWVKALDEAMRQLNSSVSLSNTTDTVPIFFLNETTTASTTLQTAEGNNATGNFTAEGSTPQA